MSTYKFTYFRKSFRDSGLIALIGLIFTFTVFDLAISQQKSVSENENLFALLASDQERTDEGNLSIQQTITGSVVDANTGEALPGVAIFVPDTNLGTTTDEDGNYSLTIPAGAETLVFSFVGYLSQEVQVNGRSEINIELRVDLIVLDEAIVTAFGLKRDQRSLGTSVAVVRGADLAQSTDVNVSRSLAGRVAGLRVNSAATGPGGSTSVIIRGASSLAGSQQPLYVIDGVPISNDKVSGGGFDTGDGISQINPNDIADITVLKGPNAAALYGAQGANGVVLISTKSGQARRGVGIELNSNVTYGRPLVMPNYQNVYGEGDRNEFRFYRDNNGGIHSRSVWIAKGQPAGWTPQLTVQPDQSTHPSSWGPLMDGTPVYNWDGQQVNFNPQPNNVNDFFQNELTHENSLSLSGGNDQTLFRLSLSNLENQSILQTNELTRRTATFRGSHQFTDRFQTGITLSYVNQEGANRTRGARGALTAMAQFNEMPRNLMTDNIRNSTKSEEDIGSIVAENPVFNVVGYTRGWSNNPASENPYWTLQNTSQSDTRDRLIGNVSMDYQFVDWASVMLRAGTDTYSDRLFWYTDRGGRSNINGALSDQVRRFRQNNVDLILSAERSVTRDLTVAANVGVNYNKVWHETTGHTGFSFILLDFPVVGNTSSRSTIYDIREVETQSIFAFGQFNWKDYLYIDWTARTDWSSTLPEDDNSFFYPSISSNFVWSDAFGLESDLLSYGSIRAAWGQAGAPGEPYQLAGTYSLGDRTFGGQPVASFQNQIPFVSLKNELTTSIEVGTDFRFMDGRLRFDATWYASSTENQILGIAVTRTSGYTQRLINAGEITNTGIELLVSGTPITIPGKFQWDVTVTYARNKNEVVELTEGVDRFQLGANRNVRVFADPGDPYGQIYSDGRYYARDGNGNRLIDPGTGLPIIERGNIVIGNAQPDWFGGIMNSINYRGFTFSSLLDIQIGGDIYSGTSQVMAEYGTSKSTLEGRDGTYVAEGMVAQRNAQGEWESTGTRNSQQVSAQDYWELVAHRTNGVTEEFIDDASYISMRELSIGYNFPTSITNAIGLNSLRVSAVGRNLFYLLRNTDGYSPEASSFNAANSGIGQSLNPLPMTRTFSFNVNIGL